MRKGDVVEDFELPDQSGTPQRLSTLLENGPVVLFFYPLAMSGGCTKEVCHFRDVDAEFKALGAQQVGISRDSVARQAEFAKRTGIDYPLLSDEAGEVAEAFGVKRRLLAKALPVKRATFVIDTDARILETVSSETDMNGHADQALAALKARQS
ncbi:peroxiredoxin [Arthrobacter russicus]|jgi:peroxiredoxin Q/BCP|uniref:thioredoxin-dependent peroxiredoxin n=1 Tax=Arthrobacter russicus TaxID=172040 RepID=A0ABU1J5U2_9MICC|nr:peroxiredoxin [Arthrobacter russicus]MDR6267785.1 peroxiredoxin Q/BCP [Arthrobacter russicus]